MTRLSRKILFYFSIIAFIGLSYVLLVFALGYNFDFISGRLVKTGAFQLRANVEGDVYLNDQLIGQTSFLQNNFSKGHLLPRTYSIRLQNPKYKTWQKKISINAGYLTDFPKIVLIPETLSEIVIGSSSFNLISSAQYDVTNNLVRVYSGKKNEIISLKTGKILSGSYLPNSFQKDSKNYMVLSPDGIKKIRFNKHEILIDWLKDENDQPFHEAGDTELITRYSDIIQGVEWYRDSAHILAHIGGVVKFIEIDTRGELNSHDITSITNFFHYDAKSNTIFGFKENSLIKINLEQ